MKHPPKAFTQLAWLLAAALATTAGCSSDRPTNDPTAGTLAVVLADGSELVSVDWTISGGALTDDLTGTIDVGDDGDTISTQISGIPVALGYTVALVGVTDRGASCSGSADFDIPEAGAVALASVTLNCGAGEDRGDGDVIVEGEVNRCPTVSMVVSPLSAEIGNTIDLSASATDADGHAVTYAWSVSEGTIADPSAASTVYTCTTAGSFGLQLVVDDGYDCDVTRVAQIECTEHDDGDDGDGHDDDGDGHDDDGDGHDDDGDGHDDDGDGHDDDGDGHDDDGDGHDDDGDGHDHDDDGDGHGHGGEDDGSGEPVSYQAGHADLAFEFDALEGEFEVVLFAEGATVNGEDDVDGAYNIGRVSVQTDATFTRPAVDSDFFAPLCVANNESLYWLPQGNADASSADVPFMGIAAEVDAGMFVGDVLNLELVSVESPAGTGAYSMWKDGFPPGFRMSSCDGVDSSDVSQLAIGHDHFNMGFAGDPGLWTVRYRVSGELVEDGTTPATEFEVVYDIGQ